MTLQQQIKEDMKTAMRAKESHKATTLRGVMAAFTNESVQQGKTPQDPLDDESALAVIKREARKRKDAIEQYEKAGRDDLSNNEREELTFLESYLPQMMTKEEIEPIVTSKIEELGNDKAKIGQIIGAAMKELQGKADGSLVKELVEEKLS